MNMRTARAAESAAARNQRVGSASEPHPDPSSIPRCPDLTRKPRPPKSPEHLSSVFALREYLRRRDNSFCTPRLYLSETTPLSLHFGEPSGSPFFTPLR